MNNTLLSWMVILWTILQLLDICTSVDFGRDCYEKPIKCAVLGVRFRVGYMLCCERFTFRETEGRFLKILDNA